MSRIDRTTALCGALPEDLAALLNGSAAVPLQRDQFTADGPDTLSFLQGQLTQNVAQMQVGGSAWSLLLQPNGRLIGLLRLTRTGDDSMVIHTEAGVGAAVRTALARFLIRTKCTLSDVAPISLWRTLAPVAAGSEVFPMAPWLGVEVGEGVLPSDVRRIGADGGAARAAEQLRVLEGMPKHGAEFSESTLPSETALIDAAVAFGKGCYVGQELVERIDSRGRVVRRLVRFVSEETRQAGDSLDLDGQAVGSVTSAIGINHMCAGIALFRGQLPEASPLGHFSELIGE
jgi:tRNA-modifying protein YgfZ